jgi:non-ribosomal peptide synthase protein (TIGR01720 family)
MQAVPQAQVSFNYLGQFGLSSPAPAVSSRGMVSTGPMHSGRQYRSYLLEVNGLVSGGQLSFKWHYSRNLHRPATIEALAASFGVALRTIVRSGRALATSSPAASNFELARLKPGQLDWLLNRFSRSGE